MTTDRISHVEAREAPVGDVSEIMHNALCRIAMGQEPAQTIADDAIAEARKVSLAQQPAAVNMAWQVQLADALECFWNAAIEGSGYDRDNIIGGMVQGVAAVATRLREHAAQPGGSDNE